MSDKRYMRYSLVEDPSIFRGYVENRVINDKILNKLARDLGFSIDLYTTLDKINSSTADSLVISTSRDRGSAEITLLVNDEEVLGYSLEDREPLLNDDFMKRVTSLAETTDSLYITEPYCISDDIISSVILRKSESMSIDSSSYDVGVLLCNNELENIYAHLVVFIGGQPIYLPASYYNLSSNRYKKSTSDSAGALEVLVLRIIDDLREDDIKELIERFHRRYTANKDILTSYEEYNTIMRTMSRIPSIIDDHAILERLSSKYEEYEQRYSQLDDRKSSYIWRCTAIGELTIGTLTSIITTILDELGAPSIEYSNIRELLGEYLCTKRIADEIAREG